MFPIKRPSDPKGSSKTPPAAPSRALDWLWQNLREVKHPQVLDCGPAHPATIEVLLKRGAKIYISDMISPARQSESRFTRQLGNKRTMFLIDDFLENLLPVPSGCLSMVACWQLFDLLPREAHAGLVSRLWSYLNTGGVLFFLLREPNLANGAGTRWWLDSPFALRSDVESKIPFPYPAITNREIERLFPPGSVKTFLTRFARREILAIK